MKNATSNMRFLICYSLLFFIASIEVDAQPCFQSGLTLNSQVEINQFILDFPTCSRTGTIKIEGATINDLSPLGNIRVIDGDLIIKNCISLVGLEGVLNIDTIIGSIIIELNENLLAINGFNSLTTIEGIRIVDNDKLVEIRGFDALHSISLDFFIAINDNLSSLPEFPNLEFIEGNFNLSRNAAYLELSGFNTLNRIGKDFNFLSFTMKKINGLQNLERVDGGFYFRELYKLTEFNGLSRLEFIGKGVIVNEAYELKNLNGFSGLKEIGGGILISKLDSLYNITALSNLEKINGRFHIEDTPLLKSLKGLHNIDANGIEFLTIYNCPSLSKCSIEPTCSYLLNPNGLGDLVLDNAQDCNSFEEILEACTLDTSSYSFEICEGEQLQIADTILNNSGFYEFTLSNCVGLDSVVQVNIVDSDNCDECDFQESSLNLQVHKVDASYYMIEDLNTRKSTQKLYSLEELNQFFEETIKSQNAYRSSKRSVKINTSATLQFLKRMQKGAILKI